MIFFETIFQGQNLYIMIGLGIFVFGVIYLMARRMVRHTTPEDEVYFQRLWLYRRKLARVQLVGYAALILILTVFLAWLRR